jgi:hypothetical protein
MNGMHPEKSGYPPRLLLRELIDETYALVHAEI